MALTETSRYKMSVTEGTEYKLSIVSGTELKLSLNGSQELLKSFSTFTTGTRILTNQHQPYRLSP